ncbi:MAG: pilin [Candidatus Gracilibacteria bacterium]|nr:pilin [Candidatus Gracilibacteria bacterium]
MPEIVSAESSHLISDSVRPDAAVSSSFSDAVRSFINYFLTFLGLIAVVFVIYAGILMVTAQGDDDKISKGKDILIWSGIGIVLIMLSYSIVRMIIGAGDSVA